MIEFQLDQNIDSKKFAKDCNLIGQVRVNRLPRKLKNKADKDLFKFSFSKERVILSLDRAIAVENAHHMPKIHSGIIIISDPDSVATITLTRARLIIESFKDKISDWPKLKWKNYVCEITTRRIEIYQISDGERMPSTIIDYGEPDWETALKTFL